jgi:hypothetical protein
MDWAGGSFCLACNASGTIHQFHVKYSGSVDRYLVIAQNLNGLHLISSPVVALDDIIQFTSNSSSPGRICVGEILSSESDKFLVSFDFSGLVSGSPIMNIIS